MVYKIFKISILVLILLRLIQCTSTLQIPTAIDEQKSGVPLDSLILGRKLYISKCNSCHNLYLPNKFTPEQWDKNVEKMQNRAKITNIEKEAILKYLKYKSQN